MEPEEESLKETLVPTDHAEEYKLVEMKGLWTRPVYGDERDWKQGYTLADLEAIEKKAKVNLTPSLRITWWIDLEMLDDEKKWELIFSRSDVDANDIRGVRLETLRLLDALDALRKKLEELE